MNQIKNPLEIYKLLPQTNCGACYLPTCLAFSAAVIKGAKKLADCPHLEKDNVRDLVDRIDTRADFERARQEDLERLKKQVAAADILASAGSIGGRVAGGQLAINSLGKDFFVDPQGNLTSECHTHAWLAVPMLNYILQCRGGNISGKWVPFRELKEGTPMNPLFVQRGEKPLKQLIDNNADLLEDIISMFSGQKIASQFQADISLVLYPLPKIPIMICYWKPDGDLESDLNIFFDQTAERHLRIESIFALGVGLVMMFDKISRKHI